MATKQRSISEIRKLTDDKQVKITPTELKSLFKLIDAQAVVVDKAFKLADFVKSESWLNEKRDLAKRASILQGDCIKAKEHRI